MQYSPKQLAAIEQIVDWFHDGDSPIFRLFGYAGTGKTTLAKEVAKRLNNSVTIERWNPQTQMREAVPVDSVQYAAFTGKACHVMRRSGCENARTLHSLLYIPAEDLFATKLDEIYEKLEATTDPEKQAELEREILRLKAEKAAAGTSWIFNDNSQLYEQELLVVDECSMVDQKMADDIAQTGVKVLVLGDPGQLPPVGGAGFYIDAEPNVMLTEIHRQAADNPIIRLATTVRTGDRLEPGEYGNSLVVRSSELSKDRRRELLMESDIVLVGKNQTRRMWNTRLRELKIDDALPGAFQEGDSIICLRNVREEREKFFNGAIFSVRKVEQYLKKADANGTREAHTDKISLHLTDEDGEDITKPVTAHLWHARGVTLDKKTGKLLGHTRDFDANVEKALERDAYQFDYAYAITCHKSQGSQWDTVYVKDESGIFRNQAKKWLYTAITRAADRVIIELP